APSDNTWYTGGKLSYPVMDDLDVYTRLGGMVWRTFNQETPAPVVEPAPIGLRSDVLFNYNKVVVIGYTNRIGSQDYNLPLSEKRAQSVVNYLVSKAALINCLAPNR
uniref:OMPA=39 kDa outer membrane protein (Fragments) n=1 Tax=Proteus mirabilis TaxID=584 RepID=Q9R659_PROMI